MPLIQSDNFGSCGVSAIKQRPGKKLCGFTWVARLLWAAALQCRDLARFSVAASQRNQYPMPPICDIHEWKASGTKPDFTRNGLKSGLALKQPPWERHLGAITSTWRSIAAGSRSHECF